ncbi:FRG domain-containing protein [Vibrio pelagius]|uniref:FRG domain-containing protein n=1 Tax=Vibrio pelagius TaxID=28169 RepID=UPI0021C2D1DD|nr:FRG domain-containing protein [Vibrio pelagius]
MKNKRYIKSLKELYQIIDSYTKECNEPCGLIYNVCDYENYNLMPGLGRSNRKNLRRVEQDLLSTVRIYGGHSLNSHDINDWLLMCLAKKQGFPTRLLEWSDNLVNALWALCHSQSKDCINITKVINFERVNNFFTPFGVEKAQIFHVVDCDQQEQRKDKWYSIHPFKEGCNDAIQPLYDEQGYSNGLVSVHVLPSAKVNLIKELISMNVLNEPTEYNEEALVDLKNESHVDGNKVMGKDGSNVELKVNTHNRNLEQYGRKYHQDFDFD